jgi:aspartyl protease family protein
MRTLTLIVLACLASAAQATGVNYVGRIGAKAVVSVNGGAPRLVAVGQRLPGGVTLVALDRDTATFEAGGERYAVRMGSHTALAAAPATVTLTADDRGHFTAPGTVNGARVRFLVDTGASLVSLPAVDARRLGIDYLKGAPALLETANGTAAGYLVKLDAVEVGGLVARNVDAVVLEGGAGLPLLGMSFLARMDMRRDGDTMALTRRY